MRRYAGHRTASTAHLAGMSQDMTAQPMTWLVLLVFVAAALLDFVRVVK